MHFSSWKLYLVITAIAAVGGITTLIGMNSNNNNSVFAKRNDANVHLRQSPQNYTLSKKANSNASEHHMVNVYNMKQSIKDKSKCVPLSKLHVQICIHNVGSDIYISKAIQRHQFWEPQEVIHFRRILQSDPELHVIDIGANIGQFSLIGASMGRKVLAVEARLKHVQMLHHSVVLNGYQSQVTIVHNALSDQRGRVSMEVYHLNQGGATVLEGPNIKSPFHIERNATDSIIMSDLLPVVNFTKALMKMDIEGFEAKALKYAEPFFDQVKIPHIFMEWNQMPRNPEHVVEHLLSWLSTQGYQCYTIDETEMLRTQDWRSWPVDVYFKLR